MVFYFVFLLFAYGGISLQDVVWDVKGGKVGTHCSLLCS